MPKATLDPVLAFHRELIALSATGLPMNVGVIGSQEELVQQLERFRLALSTRIGRGETLEQAISAEPELSPEYRAALWAWVHCDDPAVVLDGILAPAESRQRFGRGVGRTMAYPLIVLSLAYFGFLYLCTSIAPRIEAIYSQLSQSPSHSLVFLIAARKTIPVWGLLVPLLLVIAVIWWRKRSNRMSWAWVPGSPRYFRSIRNAEAARQLATLLESGCSLEDSLALVNRLAPGSSVGVSDTGEGKPGQAKTGQTKTSGSLLNWAVTGDLGDEPLPRVLRFVEKTYRQNARRQQAIWQFVLPTIGGVLLGGVVVMGYGLSLFLPVIQLLKDISLPGGA